MPSKTAIIQRAKHTATHTEVQLQNGDLLLMRPFLYLSPGDELEFTPSLKDFEHVYKIVSDIYSGKRRKVTIYPPYSRTEIICIPPHRFKVTFRERLSSKDWKAAKFLEQFHYRGKGLNKIVGRRTVLLAESEAHGLIGYGVLAATVAAARPRFELFNTNFGEQMRSKLINQLVRIPRIVVHPEFRGLGLGALIAKHLVQYAKSYWDIRGFRPIAVEVIASMTDYHRFFEKAGFTNIGYTLGYSNGILPEYGKGNWASRPNYKNYDFLENQKAKPYLIYPLNRVVRQKIKERESPQSLGKRMFDSKPLSFEPIHFSKCSVAYKTSNGLTSRAQEIKEVFDVDGTQMFSPVLKDFSMTIKPGDVLLFTGASGSGKSTLIKMLNEPLTHTQSMMVIKGDIQGMDPTQVAFLDFQWDESLPLIDQVGKSTKEAIYILNEVGLAEAHLYLKRPSQISDGQRYRFAVARLCDSHKPLWIIDDFACRLDSLTSAIVTKGLRKISKKVGATLVLAAPNVDHFLPSLYPNKLIRLRWGGHARMYALRMTYQSDEDGLRVFLTNNGIEWLSNVSLQGVNETGILKELWFIPKLDKGERSSSRVILWSELRNHNAAVVTTDEGIGDIIYLS